MQLGTRTETRRSQRVRLEVDVTIYSRKAGLVPGRTVDIGEFGVSAVIPVELGIGETVKLEFKAALDLPLVEPIILEAIVRNRNVFRYGFEFEQPGTGRELLKKLQ